MKFYSSKSQLNVFDEPFYKKDIGTNKTYIMVNDFDLDVTPQGWTVGTASGGSVSFSAVSQNGTLGVVRNTTTPAISSRAGLIFSSSGGFLMSLIDAQYTIFRAVQRVVGVFPVANSALFFGLANIHTIPQLAFGNALGFMYDPSNLSGYNPTLITNIFFIARATYNGAPANTVINLGVPPSTTFRQFSYIYDNIRSEIRIYINDVLISTLTNLANVPGGAIRGATPSGAGNTLNPMTQVGNRIIVPASAMVSELDKVSLFKQYY